MQLKLSQMMSLFGVSAGEIYRWIASDGLPGVQVGERYTFNAMDVLDWAFTRGVPLQGDAYRFESGAGRRPPGLEEALVRGGVELLVGGPDAAAGLAAMAERLPLATPVERDMIVRLLQPQGLLQVKSGGPGIVIPHIRHPLVSERPDPEIRLFYFEPTLEIGLPGMGPTHVWFWILSPTVRLHLQLMERLYMALRESDFAEAVTRHGGRENVLALAARCDALFDRALSTDAEAAS